MSVVIYIHAVMCLVPCGPALQPVSVHMYWHFVHSAITLCMHVITTDSRQLSSIIQG
jgi:hypothetical protein